MKKSGKKQYDIFENAAVYVTSQNIRMVSEDEVLEMARQISINRLADTTFAMTSPERVAKQLQTLIGTEEREVFCVLYLDSQHRILAVEKLFYGTLDAASVWPREVVKSALKNNAGAAIFPQPPVRPLRTFTRRSSLNASSA